MQFGPDISSHKNECGRPGCICTTMEEEMPVIQHESDDREQYAKEIERFKPMTEWLTTRVAESGVYEPDSAVEVVEASASIEDDHTSVISIRYLLDGKLSPKGYLYTWFLDGNEARKAIRLLLDIQLQAASERE